ncbi:GntR family transcriptional regulator [Pseudomonas syringae pv. syringae]|uniref:GntR family transcriptional regulator n=1 Tax=Pseudomonas syringae TaxID=317 RepID=UPI002009EADA|nr:GntR family transcriptional regulator [Pseudomonas syringae]MCK9759919.1 GntR family transcriptional regulator [Pseudomonas syringae pv. syringae]MCK9774910.1 GntR family transcriptional regulator [Pseudomonas syringae pv. syringae]
MKRADLKLLGPQPTGDTTVSFIAGVLTAAIERGVFKVGTEIPQQDLANYFGVSRMPVREALRAVAAKGYLEHRPHRSAMVVPLSNVAQTMESVRLVMLEEKLNAAKSLFEQMAYASNTELDGFREQCTKMCNDFEVVLKYAGPG